MNFDVAAEAYDRFMGRYSLLLSPQLADLAGVRSGQRVLDVGCGPGALTAELVRRLEPAAVAAVNKVREGHPRQRATAARKRRAHRRDRGRRCGRCRTRVVAAA